MNNFIRPMALFFSLSLPVYAASSGDTVVTPPGEGTLVVNGAPGAGQTAGLQMIARCETDPQVMYKEGSCVPLGGQFALNSEIPLMEGVYSVFYQKSELQNVRIVAGQKTAVTLSTIHVPARPGMSFRVFGDTTDASEMQIYLNDVWANSDGGHTEGVFCSFASYEDICSAIHTSPQALLGVIAATNSLAEVLELFVYEDGSGRYWQNIGRIWSNGTSATGASISVFPGVYGIEYTDVHGTVSDQYGIHVQ